MEMNMDLYTTMTKSDQKKHPIECIEISIDLSIDHGPEQNSDQSYDSLDPLSPLHKYWMKVMEKNVPTKGRGNRTLFKSGENNRTKKK